MPREPVIPTGRLEYLDALRGWAFLGVLCLHSSIFAGGQIIGQRYASAAANGVQLFFMVSAFTIFLTLERAKIREKHFLRNFFIRRFFRILPMFWVGLLLYSLVPAREPTTPPILVTLPDYLLTALCLHGFHPYSMNSVVPGGWTIAVEATFYFFAPVLFCFITGWRRALAFLLGMLLVSWACNAGLDYAYHQHLLWDGVSASVFANYAYRWFPSQLPVFACGLLTYFLSRSLASGFLTPRNGWLLLATASLWLMAAVHAGRHGLIPEPLYFSIGFLFVFLGLQSHPTEICVNAFTRLLGKISYSGYLLHFAMLLLARKGFHDYFPNLTAHPTLQFCLLFITSLALTLPAAWLTYKFVETPFIALGSRLVKYSEASQS